MSKKNKNKSGKSGPLAYLIGVRQELKKVTWPTGEVIRQDTLLVIITCVFFAALFWAVDSGFLALLQKVLGITLE